MAARTPAVGIDHPTIVPTNFEPEECAFRGGEGESDDR